jgi:hypothetical protein
VSAPCPVDAQVAAYNARDVDAFAACYAEDVVMEDAERNVLLRGREDLRREYAPFFAASPDLHAEIVTRIRIGAYVIDEERITGARPEALHAVAIYHMAGDLIDRVQFLGP